MRSNIIFYSAFGLLPRLPQVVNACGTARNNTLILHGHICVSIIYDNHWKQHVSVTFFGTSNVRRTKNTFAPVLGWVWQLTVGLDWLTDCVVRNEPTANSDRSCYVVHKSYIISGVKLTQSKNFLTTKNFIHLWKFVLQTLHRTAHLVTPCF